MPARRDADGGEQLKIAYAPTGSSRLNRIEVQFTALRSFAFDAIDRTKGLREVVNRTNVA
ncbi:hypothetical protein A6A29_08640 [Streptomyces sp. TSRI0281]|nr:hypothetical protein A6A29_08640 [Streptomyces sp. TSRI0281]